MSKTDELRALADRCERESPSYALDCQIELLCEPTRANQIGNARPYTASLDAALTLVPEGWYWSVDSQPEAYCSSLGRGRFLVEGDIERFGRGATSALSLCAAALRVRVFIANDGKASAKEASA